jgi:hypothetical protein
VVAKTSIILRSCKTLSYHDFKFGTAVYNRALGNEHTITWNRKTLPQISKRYWFAPVTWLFCDDGNQSRFECKGLETTATYNHNNQTFTIHTPHEKAQKEYIGNAAVHGQTATVLLN